MKPERKDRLDSMFEAFSILAEGKYVYVCDIQENLSRWSQRAVDYFGLPDTYMFGADSIWEEHVHPEDRESYRLSIDKILSGEATGHDMQYRALATNGNYVVCTCRGVVIRDENGNPEYFGGAIQNHSSLSYLDTVTGLRSLYGFFEDLKASFWNQETCVLLLLGLSGFSDINDLYGYTFGNSVLRSLANVIQGEFANGGAVYRMDGTKFAVLSHSLTAQQVCDVYTRLKKKVAHKFY
ncbi:MAG: diguanylate cyclase, partial [Oscillospiraceae bacterium]|nr:diguanylate cyclase [Oscillospiraceae bacterium]